MFVKNDEAKKFDLAEGVKSRILGHDSGLMVIENTFIKGAMAPNHTHEHEQAGYVVKGKFEFVIEDEQMILTIGDSFHVKPNILHSCTALEDSVIVDVFTPRREDFLEKAGEE